VNEGVVLSNSMFGELNEAFMSNNSMD
jgi:hypothetical protein